MIKGMTIRFVYKEEDSFTKEEDVLEEGKLEMQRKFTLPKRPVKT